MANPEHLAILRQGVDVWNGWRKDHLYVEPDLSEAILHRASLRGANLASANLAGANLAGADLEGVDLTKAYLKRANFAMANLFAAILKRAYLSQAIFQRAYLLGANLAEASLINANLKRANLAGTDIQGANLQNADLEGVDLFGADLRGADLTGVNLTAAIIQNAHLQTTAMMEVRIGGTVFANLDLRMVQSLDTVKHLGPSTIGMDTLYRSNGEIPEIFLRGCGVPDSMIEYARSLVAAERPIDYYSVFISYSSKDEALAKRLHADLQAAGVRCWYAPHSLEIGEPILSGIDRGIRLHDKVLLILSGASVESAWIEQEVEMALARERNERRPVLFPIRIDDAVSEQTAGWPALVWSQRHVGDFRQWTEYSAYQQAFARLLRDLKAEQR